VKYKVFIWNNVICTADDRDLQFKLNSYANEGWELFSVTPQTEEGTTQYTIFIFKKAE